MTATAPAPIQRPYGAPPPIAIPDDLPVWAKRAAQTMFQRLGDLFAANVKSKVMPEFGIKPFEGIQFNEKVRDRLAAMIYEHFRESQAIAAMPPAGNEKVQAAPAPIAPIPAPVPPSVIEGKPPFILNLGDLKALLQTGKYRVSGAAESLKVPQETIREWVATPGSGLSIAKAGWIMSSPAS
jgi:hypothetical protein